MRLRIRRLQSCRLARDCHPELDEGTTDEAVPSKLNRAVSTIFRSISINPHCGSRALDEVETIIYAMASDRTDEMSDRSLGDPFHSSRPPRRARDRLY